MIIAVCLGMFPACDKNSLTHKEYLLINAGAKKKKQF